MGNRKTTKPESAKSQTVNRRHDPLRVRSTPRSIRPCPSLTRTGGAPASGAQARKLRKMQRAREETAAVCLQRIRAPDQRSLLSDSARVSVSTCSALVRRANGREVRDGHGAFEQGLTSLGLKRPKASATEGAAGPEALVRDLPADDDSEASVSGEPGGGRDCG